MFFIIEKKTTLFHSEKKLNNQINLTMDNVILRKTNTGLIDQENCELKPILLIYLTLLVFLVLTSSYFKSVTELSILSIP